MNRHICDSKSAPLDALRMAEKDQVDLLAEMARAEEQYEGNERRRTDRVTYSSRPGMMVRVEHLGGSQVTYVVRARNISGTGMAFLHGGFLNPGSGCWLPLVDYRGKSVQVEGNVVRCRHVRGRVHEVGVRFKTPIDLCDFLCSDAPAVGAGQVPDSPQLCGRVLCVEDSIDDRELMRFSLDRLGMETTLIAGGAEAVAMAPQLDCDVMVVGLWLSDMSGVEVVRQLRAAGYARPIIAVTADEAQPSHQEAIDAGCAAVLSKPYSVEELAAVLSEFVTVRPPAPSGGRRKLLLSIHWDNQPMRPLILSFLERLGEQVERLKRIIDEAGGDLTGHGDVQKLCMDIKGSAAGYGYPTVSAAAQSVFTQITEHAGMSALRAAVEDLASLADSAARVREHKR